MSVTDGAGSGGSEPVALRAAAEAAVAAAGGGGGCLCVRSGKVLC